MRLLSRGVTTLVGAVAASIAMPALAAPAFADEVPAVAACTATTPAPVSTVADAAGWDFSESRTAGHHAWVAGGLRVYTDDTTSEAKSAGYHASDFALADAGVPSLTFAAPADSAPGLQLVTDFDNDGQVDGILVGEAVYGGDWWVPGSAAQFVRDAAPSHETGSGSTDHGTLDGWLAAFPNARVLAVGYSLGSGIQGDATITSLVAGCTEYTFGLASLGTPTVTLGAAKVGVTLTPAVSGWATAPDAVTYDWTIGSTTVGTAATYKPVAADAGKKLTLTVTGTKDQYASASSDPAALSASTVVATADFAGSPNPTLAGTVRVGSKVTAALGTWSPKPTAVAYQWRIDGKAVAGATASSFVPRVADRGHQLSVAVTATLPGYTKAVRASTSTLVGYGVFSAPKPTISGSSQVGSTLTLHRGTWTPAASSYSYRWLRNGSPISGATHSTYKVASTDRGKYLSVRVTGKASGYTTKVVTSSSVKATVPFKATHAPTITGTLRVSSTLTAHVSAWSPTATFHFQWKRNGQAISGATHSTYKLVKADHGAKITVSVTGTRSGYTTKTRTSASTTAIAWPKGMTSPKITSQPQWAAAVMNGKATFAVTATGGGLHYQWQYSSDGGHTWKTYVGKTSSTLTVTATSGVSLYRYRVVVSNLISSVTSRDGALAILSAQATPFDAGDPFLLDSWSSVVFDTEDIDWYDETHDILSAEVDVCYGDAGVANPADDLTIRLKVGSSYYDASLIAGAIEDGIGSVGNVPSGQCKPFYVYAVVPISVLNSTAFGQAVWAVTDNTNGNAFTQFVKVNLIG